ncbi:hypothetical protein ABW20_dc0108628 [Dactylellina cionopaga]|nr:hypothetical protein ABW20_dc0108628 [Dactylellina cionopaga]
MSKLNVKVGAFSLLFLILRTSAYTLYLHSGSGCPTDSTWAYSNNHDNALVGACEAVPVSFVSSIQSASLALNGLDDHKGFIANLYSDANCQVSVIPVDSDEACSDIPSVKVMSFKVTSKPTNVKSEPTRIGITRRAIQTTSTYSQINSYGDAIYNQTDTYSSFVEDLSPGSSGSSEAAGVIYPLDDANLAYATTSSSEAAIPGTTDGQECDTPTEEKTYWKDNNEDGTADGVIKEETRTDSNGNIVGYSKENIDYGQDIPGARLAGPTIRNDPTTNDPRKPDVGVDYGVGSSGNSGPYLYDDIAVT